MASSVQDIVAKLKNTKKISGGWTARCPAHDDHSNSLSVSTGASGKVLMHCHVGCTFEQITSALGEFGSAQQTTYPYLDEKGKLLYEVVRRQPKGFAQRKPDGAGGWSWNLKDVPRVLYMLPELLASAKDNKTVYVCEGEKDANRLASLGLVATTNSGGAGKWRDEYSKHLKGRDVCILPDNDDPGRLHATQVGASLLGKAKSVRILEIPGIPEKADVSDWLNAGGNAKLLEEMAAEAPLYQLVASNSTLNWDKPKQPEVQQPLSAFDKAPHNAEVERAILGGVMLRPELIDQCRRVMPVGWLHVPDHQHAYSAMLELDEKRVEITPIMIAEVLKRRGVPPIDTARYADGLSPSSDLSHYIEVVRRYAKARWGIAYAAKITAQLYEGVDNPDEVFESAVQEFDRTRQSAQKLRRPKSLGELYDDYALRLMLFFKGVTNAIPTGFTEVDEKLLGGGVVPSYTYVVAGRPSMGKSTFALDICCNAADQGFRSVFVTREMPKESLMDRMAAAKSGVPRFKIQSGIKQSDYEAVLEAAEAMRLVPIIIDDTSETIQEIDHFLNEMERSNQKVDLLVIDYLQLMKGDGKDGRTNEVSFISRETKGLAMRHEIPVIEVSQLTRAPGKEHREPELHDLRESGQIEQDADVVLFIHGDEPEEDMQFYQRELLCRKQREGPHFHRTLDMNAELITFRTPQMLGHSGAPRKRPGRITVTPGGLRDKKLVNAEQRALESQAKEDKEFDF